MKVFLLTLSLFAVIGSQPFRPPPQRLALDPHLLREAIALGEEGEPKAYPLYLYDRDAKGADLLGLIYTPFVRVALAASAARRVGRHLTPADVEPSLIGADVQIAFRWWGHFLSPGLAGDDEALLPPEAVVTEFGVTPVAGVGRRPLWVRPAADGMLALGDHPRYSDMAILAAFPPDVVNPNHFFHIYKRRQTANGLEETVLATGWIRPNQMEQVR